MSLYQNSLEVERCDETPHSRTYEEPIQVYSPNSDSFYSSLGNASTIRSFKNTTFPSAAGDPHYEKAEKVPRSDGGVKICIAILTVTAIVTLGMAAAGLALYFKVTDDIKAKNEDLYERMNQIFTRIVNFEASVDSVGHKFQKSLEIYGWYPASNGMWYKVFNARLSYEDAKENCEILGGDLASEAIRNNSISQEIMENSTIWDVPIFWIGLDNRQSGGDWVWLDGEIATENNTAWGDESATSTLPTTSQKCGLFYTRRRVVRKVQCGRQFPYMCEATKSLT